VYWGEGEGRIELGHTFIVFPAELIWKLTRFYRAVRSFTRLDSELLSGKNTLRANFPYI